MSQKKQFQTPAVIQAVDICTESILVAASIVDAATVTTTGQEVKDYDWSDSSYNHEWGN